MEWVKVGDRLPDPGERVLICINRSVFEGWHTGNRWHRRGDGSGSIEKTFNKPVTHWAKMPGPPKEDE